MSHSRTGTEENRVFNCFHRDLTNPTASSSSRMDAANTEQHVDTITPSTFMTERDQMKDAGNTVR
jgi:hypothetical protein